ncbi:MAG: hypothetical protein J2O49_11600, partial [Sciscionella sp.]|nr:hypothetical protein [Sciscionella sp.]
MRDATERAGRLLNELGEGSIGAIAYETAWTARWATDTGERVFPLALQWLRRHQHADGSWGGAVPNPYDRLVSTLAALLALRECTDDWAIAAVRAGTDYVRRHAGAWRGAPGELIGFELVAPYLVEQAQEHGLISLGHLPELVRLREDKLARLPSGMLERKPTGVLYSLEAITGITSVAALAKFQLADGSMASNPAATGALWASTGDPAALDFLRHVAAATPDGGMPAIYPIDVFEPAWVLYVLHRAGIVPANADVHVERLAKVASRAEAGLGNSEVFPVPESDDTAMVAIVLHAFGYEPQPLLRALLRFEADDRFLGFEHERGAAVSANARVLEALSLRPDGHGARIEKASSFLLDMREDGAWWSDKWQVSPYYATAQVAFAMSRHLPRELAGTWRWLLDGQHDDGSWGFDGGQPEETAYAVLALDALASHFGPVPVACYRRANTYLRQHVDADTFAELWVS